MNKCIENFTRVVISHEIYGKRLINLYEMTTIKTVLRIPKADKKSDYSPAAAE